jgi:hypothetical protein
MTPQEIYKQRIEEAAKRYAWSHDTIGVDKETFHTEASQKAPIPIHKEVRVPIYHEMEVAFKCAANFILQHQWISVEEALPKEIYHRVLAVNYHFPLDVYLGRYENGKWVLETEDQELWITHWMPIPPISEGGEK